MSKDLIVTVNAAFLMMGYKACPFVDRSVGRSICLSV